LEASLWLREVGAVVGLLASLAHWISLGCFYGEDVDLKPDLSVVLKLGLEGAKLSVFVVLILEVHPETAIIVSIKRQFEALLLFVEFLIEIQRALNKTTFFHQATNVKRDLSNLIISLEQISVICD
jgi:hypothetical protein